MMTLTYGVIAGTGVGIVYGVPIAVVAKWFPNRKGLAVGLTIIGFGLSPLITALLANSLIDLYSVKPTLRILDIIFTAIILLIAIALKMPPEDWHPQGNLIAKAQSNTRLNYPKKLLKSRSF